MLTLAPSQVKTLICQNRKMPTGMRVKLQRPQWDRIAEECACVVHMAEEVLAIMPVDQAALHEAWHQKYIEGDQAVSVEIQSAIMARSAANVRDIGTLNALMCQHASNCPVPQKDIVGMQQLERDSFDLVVRQLQYDVQALRVAKSKRSTWEATVYHAKLQHKVAVHETSMKAAQWFLQNFCKLITSDKSDEMLREFQMHRSETINRLRLDAQSCAPWIVHKMCDFLILVCVCVLGYGFG